MAVVKKSANYGEWSIEFMDTKQVVVKKNGEVCEKIKPELLEISAGLNYDYDPVLSAGYLGHALIEIIKMKETMALKIDGRMKVNQLKRNFKCIYNARCASTTVARLPTTMPPLANSAPKAALAAT